jgi:murein DD-endopeptidase MepM/ murein hydrolase activator NlpD
MEDANSIDTTDVRGACFRCEGPLAPHHFVQAAGASTLTLCSEECLRAKLHADAAARAVARRRNLTRLLVVASLVAACITPHQGPPSLHKAVAMVKAPSPPPETASLLPGSFGPEWPPSEASILAELAHDAWLHPLAGPFRRMPIRDTRVFGAERAGDRPIECRRGHCGVDLGGEIWGEQVHAVHDGIIDRVRRDPNEQHGGHYVRIAHRNGTVFTQYFHLAAIARWVEVGVPVKAGEIIGLLGDTGVKESSAHLHFTVSVRPAENLVEEYIDPEPLVALWPLRIPLEDSPVELVSTAGRVGVPLGGAPAGGMPALGSRKQNVAKSVHKRRRAAPKIEDGESNGAADAPAAPSEPTASESSE